jgi:DNA polymerase
LMYNGGQYYKFMHGGTFLENIIQAISRIHMGECMLKVERERGDEIFSVSTTHDEGLWLVKDAIAEEAYAYTLGVMRTPPVWAPDCPMNAEGGYAREYSK